MIIVFGGPADEASQELVQAWGDSNAVLMTSRDLSLSGWSHRVPEGKSVAVAGGQKIAESDITAVIVRWPAVFAEELVDIAPEDRSYVASEMTAFLLGWLSSLKCPVFNRPTTTCLMGPSWQSEQWRWAAAGLGISTAPVQRSIAFGGPDVNSTAKSLTAVTVVGEKCLGHAGDRLKWSARRLADYAGVELLEAYFDGPEDGSLFLGADLMADISGAERAGVVLELVS